MIKKQIVNISGHQTSKVFALLFTLLTIPFSIVGVLGFFFAGPSVMENGQQIPRFPWLVFAFAPLFYGVMSYIFTRFGCFAYNLVAKRVGGIELTVTEHEEV